MKWYVTLVIGMIVAAFGWFLNQDRYDLRYTLSDKIPLSFGNGQPDAVQQLEVKNLSRKEVEKIQIKLPPRVIQFELFKNSQGDIEQSFKSQNGLEILYPTLPPNGSFSLVIKTAGDGVSKHEVQINHSRGTAQEALADQSSLASMSWLIYMAVMVWQAYMIFRDISVSRWEYKSEYDAENVLKASKPVLIPQKRWKEIRNKAISEFGKIKIYKLDAPSDIERLLIYKYLNNRKPDGFLEEEWQQFIQINTEQLIEALDKKAEKSWGSANEILVILKVKRPDSSPPDKWEKWRDNIENLYIKRQLEDELLRYDAASKIQQKKPDEIRDSLWDKYQEKLAERWFSSLLVDVQRQRRDSVLKFLEKQNLQILKKDQQNYLWQRAYELQTLSLPDITDENSAKAFLENPKPEWLEEQDYNWRKQIAERILNVSDRDRANLIENSRLIKEAEELAKVKEKVLKQLAILHQLLVDPTSIDRIESYDNPFASGNFEVLKKISNLLGSIENRAN